MTECRICFDKINEKYWNNKCEEHIFCKCKGDLAHFHLECLKSWIQARNTNKCEICMNNFEQPIDDYYYKLLRLNKCIRELLDTYLFGKLIISLIDSCIDALFVINHYVVELPIYFSVIIFNILAFFINSILFLLVLLIISILVNLQVVSLIAFLLHVVFLQIQHYF